MDSLSTYVSIYKHVTTPSLDKLNTYPLILIQLILIN